MSFLNNDILIRNITDLMAEHSVTQGKLADILGMSQPNVSKALSSKDKKCFTLDQVVGIANHFGVSIDQLVGNKSVHTAETSPQSIARFLSRIIESHDAKITAVEKEEEVYEIHENYNVFDGYTGTDYETVTKKIKYPAIYFPDYWTVPQAKSVDDDEAMALISEAEQIGNGSRMIPLNDYLRKFSQIFQIFDKKGVDEDAYRVVVENYLSKLKDR